MHSGMFGGHSHKMATIGGEARHKMPVTTYLHSNRLDPYVVVATAAKATLLYICLANQLSKGHSGASPILHKLSKSTWRTAEKVLADTKLETSGLVLDFCVFEAGRNQFSIDLIAM